MSVRIGQYEVSGAMLGQGGQGTVLKGKDTLTGGNVAIKIMNVQKPASRLVVESEYQAASVMPDKIKNVCKVQNFIIEEGFAYLAMNCYDCDLFSFAFEMRETVLPERDLKILFRKICKGVKELHKNGIAHLDLKPENILLDLNTMEPFICDFGSAYVSPTNNTSTKRKRSSSKEHPGIGVRGTKKFSSPEIFSSSMLYDPFRADIYSLGVIMFMLFSQFFPPQSTDANGKETTDFTFAKDHMSSSAYSLLQGIVNPSPEERLSIDDILGHEWITGKKQKTKLRHKLQNLIRL